MSKIKWEEDSIPHVIEKDKIQFAKMYPQKNYEDCFLLWIGFSYYWKYEYKEIIGTIRIHLKNGDLLTLPPYKIRHLFPNKRYATLCIRNGRNLCDKGIVLPFDSFAELSQIKSIECYWKIIYGIQKEFVQETYTKYNLSFVEVLGKQVYNLVTKITDICDIVNEFCNEEGLFKETMEEYDKVFVLLKEDNEDFFYPFKGKKNAVDMLSAMRMKKGSIENLIKTSTEEEYRIDCFVRDITLEGEQCSSPLF